LLPRLRLKSVANGEERGEGEVSRGRKYLGKRGSEGEGI
jgi:hypothetical protein